MSPWKNKKESQATLPQVTVTPNGEERAETRGKNEGLAEKGLGIQKKMDTTAILELA
jgi:hypothetical protein